MIYYNSTDKGVKSGYSSRIALQMEISGMANRQVGEPAYWKRFS